MVLRFLVLLNGETTISSIRSPLVRNRAPTLVASDLFDVVHDFTELEIFQEAGKPIRDFLRTVAFCEEPNGNGCGTTIEDIMKERGRHGRWFYDVFKLAFVTIDMDC